MGTVALCTADPKASNNIKTPIYIEEKEEEESDENSTPELPSITYPGNDPTISPGDDYDWKGKPPKGGDKGAWVNKNSGEQLHPDLNHPDPIGPHWDYKDIMGKLWRIFEDKLPELKK